jgi:hypothetical protein
VFTYRLPERPFSVFVGSLSAGLFRCFFVWLVVWLIGCLLVGWSVDRLVAGRLIDWSVYRSVGRLVSSSVGLSVGWSIGWFGLMLKITAPLLIKCQC